MKLRSAIIKVFVFASLVSCKQTVVEQNKPEEDMKGEALIRVNRLLLKKDNELIKAYIQRHKWNLKQTESGLWIEIYKQGKKETIKPSQKVTLSYTLELLDGTKCYCSDSLGNKQFTAGAGKVEAGLDEAVQLMHLGDEARIIIPPHLAYGLLGDEQCIPPRGILVMVVKILDVSNY